MSNLREIARSSESALIIYMAILMAPLPADAQSSCPSNLPQEFRIDLTRLGTDQVNEHGATVERVYGDIGVNGANFGRFYENPARKIPPGSYKGLLRYRSGQNFVQSNCGELARQGDFLLEIADVRTLDGKSRPDILFHPGALPSNSRGCILMGARKFDSAGRPLPLDADSPLVKIRREFYGTDNPLSCPNKRITIVVKDP